MLISMTGFGRAAQREKGCEAEWVIKGVNHRFFELNVRMPDGLDDLEQEIQDKIRKACKRGRVDVTLRVSGGAPAPHLEVDEAAVRRYRDTFVKLGRKLKIEGSVRLEYLLTLPGAVRTTTENHARLEGMKPALRKSFQKALDEFLSLRKREGETLGREFTHHLSEMRGALAQLEAGLEEEKGLRAARLKSRLADLLGEEADSKRFQTEMAYVMERSDVTEELARMKSHLSQFESILGKETEAGRKLDFLLQEMHREISTMAAKCEAQAWVPVVLSLKATTEKMRQQAQNIE